MAITKHIWNLTQPISKSIWVNWLKKIRLRKMACGKAKLWVKFQFWKKLMKLTEEIRGKIKNIISNRCIA